MASQNDSSSSDATTQRVTAAASKTFKQVISVKLDDTNYLQWKQQVEGVLRGTKMVKHVVSPSIPPVFLSDVVHEAGNENPAYTAWEEQDSLLCTWILSTISPSLLSRFVHLRFSHQVWDEIHTYCYTQMKTRSRQLRSELRSITKGSRTVAEFIARVRTISESLASIGDPISHRDLIETVLEVLPEEFNAIVASVNSKVISLDELESQLLTQESRNEKFKKAAVIEPVSVNLTETSAPEPNSQGFSSDAHGNNQFPNPNPNFGGRGQFRGRGGRGGRFRGRGGRFAGNSGGRPFVQCQICFKTGHDASYCHFRFSTPQPDYYSPYGMPGSYGYGGNSTYGAPSNVWMQPMPRAQAPGQFRPPSQAGSQKGYPAQAYLTGSEAHNSFNNVWYPDSGATNSSCHTRCL
jgi:hypothetical protein